MSSPVMPERSSVTVTGCSCSATSISSWSNARFRNVEYTANTGCSPPIAMPAAEVIACCSAMPTSKQRSGNCLANLSSPVGPSIAAVMATTSARSPPMRTSSSEKTLVQLVGAGEVGAPVSGSMTLTWCIWSASWFSAGAKPLPLRVTACTITGPPNERAMISACSMALRSWPSTGPRYLMPRSENITCGLKASLSPDFAACSPV